MITITLLSLIVLLSVLIVYTPIRNILPGYSASLRQHKPLAKSLCSMPSVLKETVSSAEPVNTSQ
jgi:beta-lactamase regulating signal transducer with metallopeptidase domain